MSMRSRILVLMATVLVGQSACDEDDNNVNRDGGLLADAGGGLPDALVRQDVGVTPDTAVSADAARDGATADGSSMDGGVVDGSPADGAGDGGAGDTHGGLPSTFTQVYTTVIAQRCTPCHTTAGGFGVTVGRLDMTTKAAAYTNLVNVPAMGTACTGRGVRVVPAMPDSSILYLKVSLDDPAPCGAKMPLGLPALSQAEVDLIEGWILAGAPNN